MRCKNREILYVFLFFILFAVSHFLLVQYHMRNIAIDGKENKDTLNGKSNEKNTGFELNNTVLKRKSQQIPIDIFPYIFVPIDISTYLVLQLKQIQDNVVLLLIVEFSLHLDGRILL